MARIQLKALRKSFDDTEAVRGIDLDVEHNEFVVLVGPSGCGKSTTLRMIAGLEEITDGEIYIGDDLVNHTPPRDRHIAMVFQNYALYPHMTVYDNMSFGLKLAKTPKDEIKRRVQNAADILNIQELMDRRPKQLSGGQRQRVAIARALVTEPELIIADEPVSMIDASSRAEILYLMNELREKRGTAFVYITHDIATAYHFAQRIAVMYLGKIVERGVMSEVIANPLHPYTEALLKAVPEPDPQNRFRRRVAVTGEAPSSMAPPSGCRFHPRCSFKFGPCATVDPRLQSVRESHMAACHLFTSENLRQG